MLDLIRSALGWLVEHWFVSSILGILFLSLVYYVVLKTYFSAEDLRDIRRRNRQR